MTYENELKELLQHVGDSIANMFEQMLKGNWTDDHGHDVRMNKQMNDLAGALKDIGNFRAKHLDYTEWEK